MDDVETVHRVRNLVAVPARMNGKVGGRDLDALQESLRLAQGVPGLHEGLIRVRLTEAAARDALRKDGRHGDAPRREPASTGRSPGRDVCGKLGV
jgi:hypothetical protein